MTRIRDVIDVNLAADGPHKVSLAVAWRDLRSCILFHTGTDIDRPGPWQFLIKTVSGTGNRAMHALVAVPKAPIDMLHRLENGFCALFGEVPLEMAEAAAMCPDGASAAWARPLGTFRAERDN